MSVLIALAALGLLMLAAYRGYSVILFAPIAALGAVLLTEPSAVGPAFTGLFMEKMVGFVKLYFPVFLLGAWQVNRVIWIFTFHCCRRYQHPRSSSRYSGDRAGVRAVNLRRGFAVRRGVCGVSICGGAVPPE